MKEFVFLSALGWGIISSLCVEHVYSSGASRDIAATPTSTADFKIPPPPPQAGLAELQPELVALRKKPESPERWVQEAMLLFHTAKQFQDNNKDKALEIYAEGRALAKKAMEAQPKNVWAMMWWCANAGKMADLRRNFSSLGIVGDAEDFLLKAKELEPELDSRLPYRALGRLYDVAPSVVSVGSSKKARQHLEAAYSKFPEHPCNQVYLADFLLRDGGDENKARARKLAIDVLTNPKLKTYRYEALDWYEMAVKVVQETQK